VWADARVANAARSREALCSPLVRSRARECEFSILTIWHELNMLGLMVRRRAQRAVSNHGSRTRGLPSRRPRFARAPQDEVGVCERFTGAQAGTQEPFARTPGLLSWVPAFAGTNGTFDYTFLNHERFTCSIGEIRPSVASGIRGGVAGGDIPDGPRARVTSMG